MNTLDFNRFIESPKSPDIDQWLQQLVPMINALVEPDRHGDLPRWLSALEAIPEVDTCTVTLDTAAITTRASTTNPEQPESLRQALLALRPWRKGPFDVNGIYIDTEWRCDKKWARLQPHINLRGCNVLDVGCGNGYYGLRMLGDGANSVTGVDPNLLFCTQYQAINRFTKQHRACVLPLSIEHLDSAACHFEKVFSMGVLYHRRNPIEHLQWLRQWLPAHGELILETLVIAGDKPDELIPEGRYANMRNVWSLPTVPLLLEQLQSAGFSSARCVDLTRTDITEQRQTEWMHFHSLEQALNPDDHSHTIEGHPAPLRAIILATVGHSLS